jgi:hypothetical protein
MKSNRNSFLQPQLTNPTNTHFKMAANYSDVATVKDVDVVKLCYALHRANLHLMAIYHFYETRLAVINDKHYIKR